MLRWCKRRRLNFLIPRKAPRSVCVRGRGEGAAAADAVSARLTQAHVRVIVRTIVLLLFLKRRSSSRGDGEGVAADGGLQLSDGVVQVAQTTGEVIAGVVVVTARH
jgi:hypothetical protein